MRTCAESLSEYGLRALGREFGATLLPKGADISLCDQIVLIGSGMIWNLYFAVLAVALGFGLATAIALAKASPVRALRAPANAFIFLFRGSPLFIQADAAARRFEVVAIPWRNHAAATGRHAHTVPRDFQVQCAGETQKDLEVIVAMAARRCAVAPQRERFRRAHDRALGCASRQA